MTDFTNGQFAGNLKRVDHLIDAADRLRSLDAEAAHQADDVLRAAVVFMHSTLEEVVRSLFLFRLPNAHASILNKIPFAAHDPSHRPKNMYLGELLAFKGKYVDNVIVHSINRYIDSLNINNSDQLMGNIGLAGVRTKVFDEHLEDLQELMQRRHKIAHQMDRASESDPASSPTIEITKEQIERWRLALCAFMSLLTEQVEVEPEFGTMLPVEATEE